MRVTVYCASSSAAHPEFAQAAHDLGTLLAREGATTVYGGGAIAGLVNLISKTPTQEKELKFHINGSD